MRNSGRSTSAVAYGRLSNNHGKNGLNDTEREKEYVQMKECPRNESL